MSEKFLKEDTLITSKTDLQGNIIYANDDFLHYAGYSVAEVLYKPHNIVRHPQMPRTVFKLLWDYIKRGDEIFAFVKNRSKNGDFYWVFANITASYDEAGHMINYYSVRRKPNEKAIKIIEGLYETLLKKEQEGGISLGLATLEEVVKSYNMSYNQLVLSLQKS